MMMPIERNKVLSDRRPVLQLYLDYVADQGLYNLVGANATIYAHRTGTKSIRSLTSQLPSLLIVACCHASALLNVLYVYFLSSPLSFQSSFKCPVI